jgi:hypothetical protein
MKTPEQMKTGRQEDIVKQMMNDLITSDMLDMLIFYKKHDWIMGKSWFKRALGFAGWAWLGWMMIYLAILVFALLFGLLLN